MAAMDASESVQYNCAMNGTWQHALGFHAQAKRGAKCKNMCQTTMHLNEQARACVDHPQHTRDARGSFLGDIRFRQSLYSVRWSIRRARACTQSYFATVVTRATLVWTHRIRCAHNSCLMSAFARPSPHCSLSAAVES